MSDVITIRGLVATEVRLNTSENTGLQIASFRLCSTDRRYDREKNTWVDGNTNWFTVSMFRYLASNAAFSLNKGDRVVVTGRLRIRQWVDGSGRTGTSVEIGADALGHDLTWGTSKFTRHVSDKAEQNTEQNTEQNMEQRAGEEGLDDDLRAVDVTTGEIIGGRDDDGENVNDDGTDDGEDGDQAAESGERRPAMAGSDAPF